MRFPILPKAWLATHGRLARETIDSAVRALRSRGLEFENSDPDHRNRVGIVLFGGFDPTLPAEVARWSGRGRERVLLCAVNGAALSPNEVWELLEAGASDVVALDSSLDRCAHVAARLERWDAVDRLLQSDHVRANVIGASPAWTAALRSLLEASRFSDSSILLLGETGTGKEIAGRLVHAMDPKRHGHRFVVVECTSVNPALAGSELFGHERGAFTGAVSARDGAFSLADGGTLVLDEIGDLPLDLQPQLLRALQEKTYRRVGGNAWLKTDFRLIAATHRDLQAMVSAGSFRADLYYRIAACKCVLPPLRERREDVLLLAERFLVESGIDARTLEIDAAVREYLMERDYPGNVRDLRQLCARIALRHSGTGSITAGDIPDAERPARRSAASCAAAASLPARTEDGLESAVTQAVAEGLGLRDIVRRVRLQALEAASAREGSLARAAARLRVTTRALQKLRAQRTHGAGHELRVPSPAPEAPADP